MMRCGSRRLVQRLVGLLIAFSSLCVVSVAEEEAAADGNSNEIDYYNEFFICSDTVIVVNELQLLCDSPGTYYWGSQKYRDSANCQGGDKAKMQVEIQVTEDLEGPAYLSLRVQANDNVETTKIYKDVSVCEISSLQPKNSNSNNDDGSGSNGVCDENGYPMAGYYVLKQQFYFGDAQSNDDDGNANDDDGGSGSSFVPTVVVGLASEQGQQEFDLGGANTYACAGGDTDNQFTHTVAKTVENTIGTFLTTFGILVACVVAMIGAFYFLMRLNSDKSAEVVPKLGMQEDLLDDTDDRKIAMVGKNRDLVDF